MKRTRFTRLAGVALVLGAPSCHPLDIANPNEPDYKRAVNDPIAIESVANGAMRTWIDAYTILDGAGALSTQARTFSASWNNGNMNQYSSIDIAPNDTVTPAEAWTRDTREWQNDPLAGGRSSIDAFWSGIGSLPGFYSTLSTANDALIAVRKNHIVIRDAARTRRTETLAAFMQGAALMMIALNYDKGYIIDESTDFTSLTFSDRKKVRDDAVARLEAVATLAESAPFTTDPSFANGITYSNTQIRQIANTMAAIALAWYPREDAESSQVDWAAVAAYASNGMSAGTPVDLVFNGDGYVAFWNDVLTWCTEIDACRVSTRVAHLIDPATQGDPYPLGIGNPQPDSPDRRMGDGSFGVPTMESGFGTVPKTAKGGTDFAWSSQEIFRPDRGFYHQSNIAYIRYDASGVQSPTDVYNGYGRMPVITATVNDLLWVEALLRQGGSTNASQAAALINKTRVTRGGLPPAALSDAIGAVSDGPCMSNGILAKNGDACTLFSKLLYEYEIELLGLGPAPFYNQRRLPLVKGGGPFDATGTKRRYIQGLIPGTPREMPVPYGELALKGLPLYTWGGKHPPNSKTP